MTTESKALTKLDTRVRAVSPREVLELGKVLASSGYFQDAREAAQAVVKVLAGQELGFGPVTSMTGIYIVKGRVTLSANLIAAAIKRSERYGYEVGVLDDERCEIAFQLDGKLIGISEFTLEDAKRAGVYRGENWQRYPRNMLFARALTNGAKWYCPDIMNGPLPIQTMEEADLPELPEPVEGEPETIADSTPALPERVSEPPGGFQPNWSGFWVEMREVFGDDFRVKTHGYFGVPDENGALKNYAVSHSETEGKTLPEIVSDMRDAVLAAVRSGEPEPGTPAADVTPAQSRLPTGGE